MKALTVKKLQEAFVGKVCTILTSTVAKTDFQDQQFSDFFTAIIESLDEDGIFAKHHMTGCRNYYTWPHIIGVLEEQVIQQDDPKYEEIMQEIKKAPVERQQNIVPVDPNASLFVDPEMMASLARQAKEAQGKMLRKQ
jgi:hypothetical protein